jgi:C4-dicarboxylate-specific signal transduction histidine kinase
VRFFSDKVAIAAKNAKIQAPMKAIPPSRLPKPPVESRRRVERQDKRRQRSHPYRVMASETTVKLAVNAMLCFAAASALAQLWPYYRSEVEKLQKIQAEVKQTEGRVTQLWEDFSRSFDPQQMKSVMQEQSHLIDPTQMQVIWQENEAQGAPARTDRREDFQAEVRRTD